jgi:hypothetical protein
MVIYWKNRKTKIFFFSIIVLLILSVLPMAIPFFMIVNYLIKHDDYQQIKIDKNYRIEVTQQQPLSMTRIYVYERKFGILEKNICRSVYADIIEQTLNISENAYSKEPVIQSAKLINKNEDSIGIEYEIMNKKKVVFHSLKNSDGY